MAHQCLHDSGVLAIYVAVAALDHALKSKLEVSSSSLRDQEAWMISLMLPVHIVKGLCLEDGLRGPSHCLGSMDLPTPSHLTTAWGGRQQVCTGTDILLNPQGFLKWPVRMVMAWHWLPAQTLYSSLAFLEVLHSLLFILYVLDDPVIPSQACLQSPEPLAEWGKVSVVVQHSKRLLHLLH